MSHNVARKKKKLAAIIAITPLFGKGAVKGKIESGVVGLRKRANRGIGFPFTTR